MNKTRTFYFFWVGLVHRCVKGGAEAVYQVRGSVLSFW